ncbi:MAG: PglZ domain-containing protein [Lewinellaceae bacterium]|nr:PglZ domain-containing protein [Lewinellaceae bacterium]
MLDQWFLKDVNAVLDNKSIVVLVDESGQAGFLLEELPDTVTVHRCQDELEELHVKYLIEKSGGDGRKHLIYTNTPLEKLRYLREYCETNGMVQVTHLYNYIKGKVHHHLGLNLHLKEKEIVSAGKISIGKDQTYWMDLCHKGATQIFDLKKDLVAFLNDPQQYIGEFDDNVKKVFYQNVHEAIGEHYTGKPAQTLANEVARKILNGLLGNNLPPLLEKVYSNWLDSVTYRDSFQRYLSKFKLPTSAELWKAHPAHPFKAIDKRQLEEVALHLQDKGYLKEKKAWIKARARNPIALQMGVTWWEPVLVLLHYDTRPLARLDSLEDCIQAYTTDFFRVDRAIRELYTEFLPDKSIMAPLQEFYRHHLLSIFLEKWFRFAPDYQPAQTGLLSRLIQENEGKTAIVVGDGISYEFALKAKERLQGPYNFVQEGKDYILAAYPSETEHNMSQIYVASGEVMGVHNKREKYLLAAHPGKDIGFIQLEQVNEAADRHHYLVCSYKDLDELGEKQQQRALKYFAAMEDTLVEKIEQLLRNGYQKVYLVSDHGFVLTGLLSESDKIYSQVEGTAHVSERYIRTVEAPKDPNLITFPQNYEKYRYISFSQNISPFKTPGVYGYSHGGLAPQELITPFFCWETVKTAKQLRVSVVNKADLKSVLGNLFSVKIQGMAEENDLFQSERKVQLLLFHGKEQVMKSDIITIQNRQQLQKEFEFDGKDTLELRVIDANTKETLDSATIKQDKGRDLGGLL